MTFLQKQHQSTFNLVSAGKAYSNTNNNSISRQNIRNKNNKNLSKIHKFLQESILSRGSIVDVFLLFACFIGIVIGIVSIFGQHLFLPSDMDEWCTLYDPNYKNDVYYANPSYDDNPCLNHRTDYLLFLTMNECEIVRRLLSAMLFGSLIGLERRHSMDVGNERGAAAKSRTLALVSLGAASFTLVGISAFKSSTMGWDSSRVSAAIPSGVGFLGTALIYKKNGETFGLTSASSLWISAAAGVGAGGGLYFASAYSVVLSLIVLRFGPQLYSEDDDLSYSDDERSTA